MQVAGSPFRRYPKQIINIHAVVVPWGNVALALSTSSPES
jgi:hypothetical protein